VVNLSRSGCSSRAGAVALLCLALLAPTAPSAQSSPKPSKPVVSKPAARPAAAASSSATASATQITPNKPGFSYSVGPAPSWVVPAEVPATSTVEAAPMHYRFIDEQVRVDGRSMAEYTRVVRVVNQTAGLPVASQIELEFDPSYQTLALHRLDVQRQGTRLNKIDTQRIQLLQREKGLEQSMYDGRATLSVVLDDVRVGDEIDIAYTVTGLNPVFAGKFVHHSWMSSHRGPVALYQVRLLAPADRVIHTRVGPADVVSQSKTLGAMKETTWRRSAAPALRAEPGALPSVWLAEQISFSEFADWAAVATWGESLFKPKIAAADSGRLASKVAEIKANFSTPDSQVREALRFVQQDVRYFGVEIGTSTHQPAAPDTVMERRFGDCKDKVGLLGALLQGLGVASRPVLVSTRYRADVARQLPSPLAFDHVIARVELDGRSYLLDATRAHQRGPLASRQSVGLVQGLDLVAGTSALSSLPAATDVLRLQVDDKINVVSFKTAPALLSRITYRNDLAEGVHDSIASQGLQAVADAVSAPYVRAYPKLRRTTPARVESADDDDAITIVQEFELLEFWRFPEQRVLQGDIVQWAAVDWLVPPKTESRRMALGLPFQGVFKHRVRVDFPEEVWTKASSQRSDEGDAHFSISLSSEGSKRGAEFTADVRISADRVEPAQWQSFSAQLNKLLPRLGAQLSVPLLSPARMDRLSADGKALDEGLRSRRVKAQTQVQAESMFRAMALQAQLDGDRLSPPLRAQALVARGVALDNTGRSDEGRQAFEAALALEPESVEALNGAAVNALGRGDAEQAINFASRVLKLQPRDNQALHTRAMSQHLAGRWPQAQADWQAGLADRAMQRRGYPLLWLALATRRAGADVGALLQSYPRENWPTDWPRPLLEAAFGQGTPEAAMQAAKASKTPLEAQTEAFFYLGEKLYAEGDTARARDQWRKALELGVVEFVEHGAAKQRLASTR
jgi:lipoprotein NlpI/transglutaminase-like putative cysteine protease